MAVARETFMTEETKKIGGENFHFIPSTKIHQVGIKAVQGIVIHPEINLCHV